MADITVVPVGSRSHFPGFKSPAEWFRVGSPSAPGKQQHGLVMAEGLRRQFELFHFVLEATKIPNSYRFREFQGPPRSCPNHLPPDRVVTLTNHEGRYPVPSPRLLAVHAAIGNILHLRFLGEKTEELERNLAADVDRECEYEGRESSLSERALLSDIEWCGRTAISREEAATQLLYCQSLNTKTREVQLGH
ncbi:hypothetical protein BDW59DRAFT_163837 [Aspergillus cavernicola]|uniref:HNH nuclease domain-containing protein n=1 Tax=Aspergillus cavernicola TaxID=176166 RepID=A0ABR4I3A6_9EURO